MLTFLRNLFRRSDPTGEFRANETALLAEWFRIASTSGMPKGLNWIGYDSLGESRLGVGFATAALEVRFEPMEDGVLADVPQAREPRRVIAIFRYRNGKWTTDGRAVFNLSLDRVTNALSE